MISNTKEARPRMTVAMLVWNTLEHDARVRREAGTLAANGYEVTVFGLHAPKRTLRRETLSSGVRIRRIGFLAGARLGRPSANFILRLAVLLSIVLTQMSMLLRIAGSRPDVIHAHDVNMLPVGWLAAAVSRANFVYDAHEISTGREGYRRRRHLVASVEKNLLRRADAVITTTELRSRYLSRAYGVKRPFVLQNRPVIASLPDKGRMRRALGIRTDRVVVLYQGGLQQGRGLEMILHAAAEVREADFVFIGSGKSEPRLKKLAEELGVNNRAHFVPARPVDELPEWTVDADIGLQVLENTCFNHFSADSNKLFEYLVSGVPVIASDLPEIRKIIRRFNVGLLIQPGSVDDLIAALRRLIKESSLRSEIKSNAAESCKDLGWHAIEHRLLDVYSGLTVR